MKEKISLAPCNGMSPNGLVCRVAVGDIKKENENMISICMGSTSADIDNENTEMLKNYYGIEAEDVVSFEIRMNSSGVEQDEIVMIEAANEEAADRIEEALDRRLDDKENQMKNYLPEEYQMLEKCDVEQEGVYVTMFLSDDAQKMEQIFNSYLSK